VASASEDIDHDAGLMLRVKNGDFESYELLFEKHRLPVVRFLYRMLQDHAVAEELAQEVFLRAFRSRSTYVPTGKFTTWIFFIATNLARNARRDGRHDRIQQRLDTSYAGFPARQMPDRRPSAEFELLLQARIEEVRRAVAELPARQRAAVQMHKYEEMRYTQIAAVLGCSEPALKTLLFRAHETLRSRLAHLV